MSTQNKKASRKEMITLAAMAFVGGLLFVVFGFVMGCEVVQPLIDNAGVVEPVKEVEEYFLIKPGIGLEFQTVETNEPVYINFTDTVNDIVAALPESSFEFERNTTYYIREDFGRIGYFKIPEGVSFSVAEKDWRLDNGIKIGSTRKEVHDQYGTNFTTEGGTRHRAYLYLDPNIIFLFTVGDEANDNDPVKIISIQYRY